MIVIVPCGSKKRNTKCYAGIMYLGSYHKACLEWALSVTDHSNVFILSAKYGLLKLNDLIEPYDLFMGDAGCVSFDVVKKQLDVLIKSKDRVYAVGGQKYMQCLKGAGLEFCAPLQGVGGMGYQIRALKRNQKKVPKWVKYE